MVYLLLPNGTGVLRRESITLDSSVMTIEFANAPADSVVLVNTPNMMFKTKLKDGAVSFDITRVRGEIKFTIVSGDQRWKCDPIHIGEGKDGGIFIATKTNLGEKIAMLSEENIQLNQRLIDLERKLLDMKRQLDRFAAGYKFI